MTFRRHHLAAFLFAGSRALAAGDATVIFPGGTPGGAAANSAGAGSALGPFTLIVAVALALAGGWLLWRNRSARSAGREARLLAVNETRSLGNRQYLVVASYDGKKFLLGVCPGRIELLSPLSGAIAEERPAT
jgi:flagellar protein FliO/FliZ